LTGLPVAGNLQSGKLGFLEAVSFTGSLLNKLIGVKSEYDLVEFSQTPVLHLGLAGIVRRSKVGRIARLVCHVNEVWPAYYWIRYAGLAGGILGFGLERYAFGRFDHLITISHFNRERMVNRGLDGNRITVIRPGGVDIEEMDRVEGSDSLYDLIFVGRLVKEKGVELLPSLVSRLEDLLGRKVRMAIVGTGPESERLRKESSEFDVLGSITFFDRIESQSELYSLLKSSRIFVYPAAPEGGWSLAMLEANAAGLPVVSSARNDIGTSEEIIKQGINGVIVPSCSAASFAETIGRLLESQDTLTKLSASSREYARLFDWNVIGSQTIDLYRRLVAER